MRPEHEPTRDAAPHRPRWLDTEQLTDEERFRIALVVIRDETPHTEYANTYCPACLAHVTLDPSRPYGEEASADV